MKNKIIGIILILVVTLSNALGQYLLKTGTNQTSIDIMIIFNLYLIAGILLYGVSAFLLVVALKFWDLNVLYPMVSLTFVWVTLISVFILGESIKTYQLAGIGSILFGVSCIAYGGSK